MFYLLNKGGLQHHHQGLLRFENLSGRLRRVYGFGFGILHVGDSWRQCGVCLGFYATRAFC